MELDKMLSTIMKMYVRGDDGSDTDNIREDLFDFFSETGKDIALQVLKDFPESDKKKLIAFSFDKWNQIGADPDLVEIFEKIQKADEDTEEEVVFFSSEESLTDVVEEALFHGFEKGWGQYCHETLPRTVSSKV